MHPLVSSLTAPAIATALLLGSGCVAFNVGQPEVITDTRDVPVPSSSPVAADVASVGLQVRQIGTDRVVVSLGADVDETFEKRSYRETWTIRKRRRLGVGLFPGMSEILLMPDKALSAAVFARKRHATGEYADNPLGQGTMYILKSVPMILMCCIPQVIGTVNSLLVEPFGPWECEHDFVDPDYVRKLTPLKVTGGTIGRWQASESPKIRVLSKYANQLGVHTCLNSEGGSSGLAFSHMGLVGIHKYVAVFVDGPEKGPSTVIGTESKRRSVAVTGPYIVEFSIPDLDHMDWRRVAARETETTFPLPMAPRNCTAEAVVTFRPDHSAGAAAAGDITRKALAKAAEEQRFRIPVTLKGRGTPDGSMYEVLDIRPLGGGKYVVRVAIKDKSKTFSISRSIEGEIKRLMREDYFGKHPETPAKDIRETTQCETEDSGSILVYTGWAFSVRPVRDGWFYDSDTRRGWVRLRISGEMPAEDAKRWARENITAIVSEKNVVLEAGKAPPSGATYRSLAESFKDGVLTVEFEAVQ